MEARSGLCLRDVLRGLSRQDKKRIVRFLRITRMRVGDIPALGRPYPDSVSCLPPSPDFIPHIPSSERSIRVLRSPTCGPPSTKKG